MRSNTYMIASGPETMRTERVHVSMGIGLFWATQKKNGLRCVKTIGSREFLSIETRRVLHTWVSEVMRAYGGCAMCAWVFGNDS
eukprot:1333142-Amorphochlora_amoeboformis.AAC.1